MERLSKSEISKIISSKYNLDDITNIKKINRGTADIYLIETLNKKYIFKYFQEKYNQEKIEREISIIKFLNDKIPTPNYLETLEGNYFTIYNNRVIIMQHYIEGDTKEKNLGSEKEVLDSAKYLGKIVKELEKYNHKYQFNVTDWFSLNTNKVIKEHEELLTMLDENDQHRDIIIRDINKKISIIKNLKNDEIKDIANVSIKFTHGDYSVMQFIYENEEIKAILDFVSACDMPIAWEIIRSYSYIDKKCAKGVIDIDNLVKYVQEFNKYVKLNKYDLIYMPYIYLIQLIKSTFGYKQYIREGNLELLEFGIFRTKIIDFLYENKDEISNVLLKSIKLAEDIK